VVLCVCGVFFCFSVCVWFVRLFVCIVRYVCLWCVRVCAMYECGCVVVCVVSVCGVCCLFECVCMCVCESVLRVMCAVECVWFVREWVCLCCV